MTHTNKEIKRSLWTGNWSYKEGFIISSGLFIAGLAIEWANGLLPLPALRFPSNLIFGMVYISLLILSYFLFEKSKWVGFMKSIPAAITSISFFALVALLMGSFLQAPKADGIIGILSLNKVTSSWYYLLANLYLLTALGMLVIDKLFNFKIKELGIFVSHLGLWIVIFAASLGSYEINRLEMNLQEGKMSFSAIDRQTGTTYEMPFAIKLKDFRLEEYPPKMGIVDNVTGKLLHEQGKNIRILDGQSSFNIMQWKAEVLEFLESAGKSGGVYYYNNEIGSPPAVKIRAVSEKRDTVIGWITCGSFNAPYEGLKLDKQHSMIMLFPEPKNYISQIELYTPAGKQADVLLEVNKPFNWDGWKIYQISYDDEFGKWSDESVIELVRDPWLPVVYFGIFLMLSGALYMFWIGRGVKIDNK